MIGRKVPSTKSRALKLMQYNEYYGKQRKKKKKQAIKEDRKYLLNCLHCTIERDTMHLRWYNMEGFYSIEEFPIPSTWIALSGNYGYIATGKDMKTEDILVDQFTGFINGHAPITNGVKRAIDYFKIQYRYTELPKDNVRIYDDDSTIQKYISEITD